jgi:gliding motility-associated-like protein
LSLDSFYVSVAAKSNANFTYSIDSCLNRIYLKNNSTAASNYKWQVLDVLNSNEESPYFDINTASEYEILLIANPNSNCADSMSHSINLGSDFGNHFFIPNTFTPNNDAINDEFSIGTWTQCKNFKLFIYNRWGNLIHQTEGARVKWDGKFNGMDAPTGVYVYLLQIGEIEKTGTVTLYR